MPTPSIKNLFKMSKNKGAFMHGLEAAMKDPSEIYKETENIVVIYDKYPKAKIHYLVLPREKINSIYNLNKTHISLMTEFGSILDSIKRDHEEMDLIAGFHAVPSMQRLHMHIISTDMNSPCLKTKVHWNSFTTAFFIPYKDVLKQLKEDGSIECTIKESLKPLLTLPLKCNQCDFTPKNMPSLKQHLLSHLKEE